MTRHLRPVDRGAPPAIEFDRVDKRFGDDLVLEGLSFDVSAGTILGLIGPSGCGKTTTIRLATGVYRPDGGEVRLLGAPPDQRTSGSAAIGYLPQEPVLFDELSLWENLDFHASLNGVRFRRRARLREMLALVELDGHERKLVRYASGGMKSSEDDVRRLEGLDQVLRVEPVHFRRLRLTTTDAGAALPLVIDSLKQRGHELVDSEEVLPSFDDVFVSLVSRQGAGVTVPEEERAAR